MPMPRQVTTESFSSCCRRLRAFALPYSSLFPSPAKAGFPPQTEALQCVGTAPARRGGFARPLGPRRPHRSLLLCRRFFEVRHTPNQGEPVVSAFGAFACANFLRPVFGGNLLHDVREDCTAIVAPNGAIRSFLSAILALIGGASACDDSLGERLLLACWVGAHQNSGVASAFFFIRFTPRHGVVRGYADDTQQKNKHDDCF